MFLPDTKMPFKYKAAGRRNKIDKLTLRNALEDVDKGKSIRGTATKYGIDRNTLRNYVRNTSKLDKLEEFGNPYKASQVFTSNEEKALANYFLTCSRMNYGLTRKNAMRLAVEFGKVNFKKVPQSWLTNDSAGKNWFRGFMQ